MRPFEYSSAESVEAAIALLGGNAEDAGAVRPLAGGTDLLTLMKADLAAPERLVDIKRAAGLDGAIRATGDGLTIGALATLAQIETHAQLRERYPMLAEAAAVAATPQLRHMATLGGNLLQRPRCWYYRDARVHCWLKGGDECQAREGQNRLHALFGGGPCYATHPSDIATALLALDAAVRLRGPGGKRTVPLADFCALPTDDRRVETTLAPDELALEIRVPGTARALCGTYLKAMDRKVWAFALVGVAAAARLDGGRIVEARLALGGVAPIPWRARDAERLLTGATPGADLFERAAEAAFAGAQPLAHNGYKVTLGKALVRRALEAVCGSV